MAIEAAQDMASSPWSCAIVYDDPSQIMPSAGLYNPDDPRLPIGGIYGGSNGVTRYLREIGRDPSLADRLPHDYQIRAIASLASNSRQPNADQVLTGFESILDDYFGPCCIDVTPLWDRLIDQGGYVQTPESAVPDDQIFTIIVGVDASARLLSLHDMMYNSLINNLERTIDGWLLDVRTNPNAPSLAEWMRDAGAADWL